MPLANERLALVVGDASGKGVAAALMIASVQSSLRTAALFTFAADEGCPSTKPLEPSRKTKRTSRGWH